jgi:signal transduction histidine kinase
VRSVERGWSLARRFGVDVLIVLAALESALEVVVRHDTPRQSGTSTWIAALAIAAVVVVLLARRHFPFAAPAALWVLAAAVSFVDGSLVVFPVSAFLAAMVAAFLLGHLREELMARLGLAIVIGGAAIVMKNDPGGTFAQLILIPALFAIVWTAGFALRQRGARTEAAEERALLAEREREAATRAAVAEERARIARELHDTVAHAISVMVLQVGAVRHHLPEDEHERRNALRDVEQVGRTALTDMRRFLDVIRMGGTDMELAPLPGLDRLDALLEDVGRAGLPVRLRTDGHRVPLPGGIDISAYRIIQEGLTNVLKHAHASQAEVSLHFCPDQLRIEVRDDGRGAGHGSGDGHGLAGIRERVALFGGRITAGNAAEGGFLLSTRLPLT